MKNDKLKKHHFWILLGLVPLFVLIAVVTVTSSVGGAIDARNAEIEKSQKALSGKTAKPNALLAKLDQTIEEVQKKKGKLWEDNWNRQKGLFTWPASRKLKDIERMGLKFGAKIPDDDFAYDEFKKPEVYLAEFSVAAVKDKGSLPAGKQGMADAVAPTQFNGGWERVIRHVNNWGTSNLASEQLWLVLEDVWVQRSMLDAVRTVNAQMGEFHRVKYEKNGAVIDDPASSTAADPVRRRFESRTWAVELEVQDKDNKKVLAGRLINLTDRLQLMGLGNTLVLRVWLQKGGDAPPFEFKIGGEFLPGRGATKVVKDKDGREQTVPANVLDVLPTDDHVLPATLGNDLEIVKVEQVFDTRTVPVRRIEAMELGKTDSRHAASTLQMPKFPAWEKEAAAAAEAASAGTGSGGLPTGSGPGSLGGPPMGGTIAAPPGTTPGGPGGTGGAAAATRSGGGSIETVVNANKKRYIALTEQVRRLPVGIVVVVDQAYMQDVLLAFANSPLRFQITQVNWTRFRGKLDGLGTGTGSTDAAGGGIVLSGSGSSSSEFNRIDPDFRPGGLPGKPLGPLTPMVGSGSGGPPGMGIPASGPGTSGGYNPYGPGAGNLTTVSESQLTSGLIELSIYGVVSLYEKYEKPAPEGTTEVSAPKDPTPKEKAPPEKEPAVKDKTPADKTPADKTPADKTPKDPMTADPKAAKMRRRGR